jgi:hypothetical protein
MTIERKVQRVPNRPTHQLLAAPVLCNCRGVCVASRVYKVQISTDHGFNNAKPYSSSSGNSQERLMTINTILTTSRL